MIFAIDHIVFASSTSQSRDLGEGLAATGFQREAFALEFPEIGAASESLSFAGGGFVEFVVELDPALSPRVWFERVPRVIGLGFGSDDFERDTHWSGDPDAWLMNEDHVLPDGSRINIHAAGPHHHLSDFYVFVMDREKRRLQFPERVNGPRLRSLTFVGRAAASWRERLAAWLAIPARANVLRVGDVELRFQAGDHPNVAVSPAFEVATGAGEIPLAAGSIELA